MIGFDKLAVLEKVFCWLALVLFLMACEGVEGDVVPPFVFYCDVALADKTGSSSFKENKDKIREIVVNTLNPDDAYEGEIEYNEYKDCLTVMVAEWRDEARNGIYDYAFEIVYPEEIRDKRDTVRIRYRFDSNRPHVVSAFCSGRIPVSMDTDYFHFRIKNN